MFTSKKVSAPRPAPLSLTASSSKFVAAPPPSSSSSSSSGPGFVFPSTENDEDSQLSVPLTLDMDADAPLLTESNDEDGDDEKGEGDGSDSDPDLATPDDEDRVMDLSSSDEQQQHPLSQRVPSSSTKQKVASNNKGGKSKKQPSQVTLDRKRKRDQAFIAGAQVFLSLNKKNKKLADGGKSKLSGGALFSIDKVLEFKTQEMKTHKKKEEQVAFTHILPLLVFLGKDTIVAEKIGRYDGVNKVLITEGIARIAELRKMVNDWKEHDELGEGDSVLPFTHKDIDSLEKKFGRKWWKLPSAYTGGSVNTDRYLNTLMERCRGVKNPPKYKICLRGVKSEVGLSKYSEAKDMLFITPVLHYELVNN